MNLENKVIVITGGATGIGEAITRQCAALGATVIVNYRSSEASAMALQAELQSMNQKIDLFKADVSQFLEAQQLVDFVIERHKRIDVLVNNAGMTKDNLVLRMSENDFDDVIQVNLKGTWNMSKHALKYMAKEKQGKIINIASVIGLVGNAGQSNYAASKAGIIGLTKSLAREFAKRNICINAIAPGLIRTKMTDVLSDDQKMQIVASIPLGRFGEASDVAQCVAFLSSEAANYITGQVINVDGGMVMQ